MSAFNTRCTWLPCSKPLGVTVWRPSKFSNYQFCSEDCCKKWQALEEKNQKSGAAQEYRRLLARHPTLV